VNCGLLQELGSIWLIRHETKTRKTDEWWADARCGQKKLQILSTEVQRRRGHRTSLTTRQASRLESWCRNAVNLCQSKEYESGYVKTQELVARLLVGSMGIGMDVGVNDAAWVISEGMGCIYRKVVDASVQSVVNGTDRGENEARI